MNSNSLESLFGAEIIRVAPKGRRGRPWKSDLRSKATLRYDGSAVGGESLQRIARTKETSSVQIGRLPGGFGERSFLTTLEQKSGFDAHFGSDLTV